LRLRTANSGPFRILEEEQLILDRRTADGEPELIACEHLLINAVGIVVKRVRSQVRNAIEFVCRPVKIVGPSSGSDIYNAPCSSSKFGSEVACDDAKLFDRIQGNFDSDVSGELVVVRHAIKHDVRRRGPQTVDCNSSATTARIAIGYIADGLNKVVWIPCQGGKKQNLLTGYRLAKSLRFRIDSSSGGLYDFDRGGQSSDFHFDV
jgi:hypothetical protein